LIPNRDFPLHPGARQLFPLRLTFHFNPMKLELTPQQKEAQASFRAFVDQEIMPHADRFDEEESLPSELIGKLRGKGYFGANLSGRDGGRLDMLTYGLLHEEAGRGCSSVRSLLTVHDMSSWAVQRWGSRELKERWLPSLSSGAALCAFGLSEPQVGSDARSVETTATLAGDYYVLQGVKRWITGGQIADLFLIFAQCDGKPAAFLVEREREGLSTKPITGMLGTKASMLAEVHLDQCREPKENLVGRIGVGFSHVASTALDHGRYSVAWGCVGIAQACLEASLQYINERKQFGVYLKEHQLIQQMITNMIVNVKAARLLCLQAGYLKETNDPTAIMETSIAKYFASTALQQITQDAVQLHGANGCSRDYPVGRYLRDARIMQVIEGSTQIQQIAIAKYY
jgi:glutaryl-CoA dehydrogenase (non-decarboxylating)